MRKTPIILMADKVKFDAIILPASGYECGLC